MTTAAELLEHVQSHIPFQGRYGCVLPSHHLKVRFKRGDINIYTVDAIDVDGQYPNSVHLRELGHWWNIEQFDLVEEVVA